MNEDPERTPADVTTEITTRSCTAVRIAREHHPPHRTGAKPSSSGWHVDGSPQALDHGPIAQHHHLLWTVISRQEWRPPLGYTHYDRRRPKVAPLCDPMTPDHWGFGADGSRCGCGHTQSQPNQGGTRPRCALGRGRPAGAVGWVGGCARRDVDDCRGWGRAVGPGPGRFRDDREAPQTGRVGRSDRRCLAARFDLRRSSHNVAGRPVHRPGRLSLGQGPGQARGGGPSGLPRSWRCPPARSLWRPQPSRSWRSRWCGDSRGSRRPRRSRASRSSCASPRWPELLASTLDAPDLLLVARWGYMAVLTAVAVGFPWAAGRGCAQRC